MIPDIQATKTILFKCAHFFPILREEQGLSCGAAEWCCLSYAVSLGEGHTTRTLPVDQSIAAAKDCLKKSCSPVVPQLIGRLNEAGRLLAEHQEMTLCLQEAVIPPVTPIKS